MYELYVFKIVSYSGWSMTIYIDIFFPCTQRDLLKLIKLIKASGTDHEDQELQELLKKVQLYHEEFAPIYEHEKLCRNEALIMKKLDELTGGLKI